MYLETLDLQNFRNLTKQKLSFKDNVVVFFGDNAQGKTNLLEAIYLLATSKSFRAGTDHELIAWGQEFAKVSGRASLLELELTIFNNKKKLLINKQEKRLTELLGSFIAVLFTPAEVEIVAGSPEQRRRFLDLLGIVLSRDYLVNLARFNKALKNRNQLLWQVKQGRSINLSVWDEQLSTLATAVWIKRYDLVSQLNQELKVNSQKLLGGQLNLVYEPLIKFGKAKDMKEQYLENLTEIRNEEVARGKTLLGPQRDNFKTILELESAGKVVSKDLEIYGSRGEQRAAVVALKLAEIEIINRERASRPVLLLDEVLGELDNEHQRLLLAQVRKGQTFLTTTTSATIDKLFSGQVQKFEVSSGVVRAV